MLLGLQGLRGLGCALTWGYESIRSHGQDGVGARAVQIEHIGSAHDDAELAVLKEVARQRLNAGQLSFDLPGLNSENDAGSAPQEPAGAGCVAPIPDGSAPGGPGDGLEGSGAGRLHRFQERRWRGVPQGLGSLGLLLYRARRNPMHRGRPAHQRPGQGSRDSVRR